MPHPLIIEPFNPVSFELFNQHSNACSNPLDNICASRIFAPFSQLSWSMLLHSGNSQHENSRFDIIVANPIATICSKGTSSTITNGRGTINHNHNHSAKQTDQDPLEWIKQTIADNLPKLRPHNTLPFLGGALGYFGYDLGSRYEVLPNAAFDDMHTPDLAVGIYDWAIIKDNHANKWWFVSHKLSLQEVINQAQTSSSEPSQQNFKIDGEWISNMDESQYLTKFNQVQDYLKSGDCYQINLAQRFSNQYQGEEFQAFTHLLNANQAPFSAYLSFDKFKVISVSPERLLSLNEGNIQSKPIKGTIKCVADAKRNQRNIDTLRHSIKDRAENVMIVDLLRNDIGKVSKAGSVKVPRLFDIESFPAVHHLVSTVTGQLKPQLHGTDLLRAAFPGGSITGAPKVRAMEIIDQLEPHRRSIYCGSIGYICCSGNMDTSITIRTLLCKDKKIHAWAGGGIVADSTCNSEYQETFAKVSKILPVLSGLNQIKPASDETLKNDQKPI